MSALSTPGGGGTTAQNKPTSGKQKFQKLDINSLYCANRNESSEPSLVKSQLSRKHGMQSLGKVPSARRPPANLPSLKTETGQDPNTNSVSVTTTTVSTPSTCTSQTTTTTSSNANAGAGGWVPLPPPSSPHFRTEFPSLEASAQPSHRSTDHNQPQPSLRPQTEGSWTCGGVSRNEPTPTTTAPPAQQTPAFRAILPPFLMKGSSGSGGGGGGGGGLGGLGALGGLTRGPARMSRAPPPPPRAVEVLTARPILREEQISSLDDIRDAGWAQHDDIDYDQKLDFSDGESQNTAATKINTKSGGGRATEMDSRAEPGDEEQLWAERRQKQNNEVAQAVLRARQRKEEEQRRQNTPLNKDIDCKEQNDNRDKERTDNRERDRIDRDRFERDRGRDNRDRADPDKDRMDARDRDRFDRDRERSDRGERDRDRQDRDRQDRDRQDRDRQDRDRQDRDRQDRDRQDRDRQDRDRQDRDRQDRGRQDHDRQDRDRQDRGREDRDRQDRDRPDRERADRERADRDRNDRDFRERDRDYGRDRGDRDRNQSNPAFSKTFQANIPPRFQKQQAQGRQDGWAFNKPPQQPRRPEPAYAAPRHNRRSFSRDSDREDDYRRETAGPQWRSEMQDYERPARELDRSNSKESYKDYEYKERRGDSERRSIDGNIEPSSRTAADKLSEVFERKSVGLVEPFAATENSQTLSQDRRVTPPSVQRDSVEKEFGKTSWADVAQDEAIKQHAANKPAAETARATPPRSSPDPPSNTTSKYQGNQAPAQNFTPSHNTSNTNVLTSTATTPYQSHSTPVDTQPVQKPNEGPKLNVNDSNLSVVSEIAKPQQIERLPQNGPQKPQQKVEKEIVESGTPSTQSTGGHSNMVKPNDSPALESAEGHRRPVDDRRNDRYGNDQSKLSGKEPVERKSSGSGSEKKGRRYSSSGYAVYGRGWGRDGRGRRPGRSSRSHTRASESDASTDTAPPQHERRRRRAPPAAPPDAVDTREPFAPRGQPSRRGRGGFQGAPRANVPPKRVAGYGPPNTKSPFSQANRVKDSDEAKESPALDEKARPASKGRAASTGGRGRDRRGRGPGCPVSGEDDNWETTSEHSEGGGAGARRRSGNRQQGPPAKGPGPRGPAGGQRPGGRGAPPGRNDAKAADVTETVNVLKLTTKKDEEVVDDGFQEVRNKKNSKDSRGPPTKEEIQQAQKPRSHSNQGNGRNGSTSRNPNEKTNLRGSAPVPGKPGPQYDRPRPANLAPRFVKQRQKQQMGMTSGIGPDTGAAPPPPTVNAWDKPIAQTLRGTVEETGDTEVRSAPPEAADTKPTPSSVPTPCAIADKAGVLDGTTPPVETIIFENTNYKNAPPAEALKQKYQQSANVVTKPTTVDEQPTEVEARPHAFNGDNRPPARSIQELIDSGQDNPSGLALPIQFESPSKPEDSSDMKLDFAFASDLGLTEEKTSKSLGLPRGVHMSTSNTISPLAADLNQKIASVKKVWEMPAVAEGAEELQFAGFEEGVAEPGAQPNVCKVKPTQQLQSPPPQHYNHVGYQGGYGGLSVSSPPAVMFNSSQQLLGSSQQLPQQGGLYGFLDQSRGQFGGFPATPYGAGSAAPYNYQPADMFQSLPNQYRMAAAGGAAAFGQSGQLGNSPSTVLISSTSNSLMSATVKPSTQQIGAIGSKGGAVGGVGGVGGVNTFQQQYLGYSGPEAQYSLQGLLPRPAPPANSYYSPYQPGAGPAPTYPLQFTQPAQSGAFGSQFLSSQLQVAAAAAVQQMQQQYRAPMQQQFARPPAALKSPLHEHNGMPEGAPSPKPPQKPKPPHSPPHKYHPHHQHYQHPHQQMVNPGNNGRCGGGGAARAAGARYPAPIQRPPAPGAPAYRPPARHAPPRLYYQQHQRNGCGERAADADTGAAAGAARTPPPAADLPPPELPAE